MDYQEKIEFLRQYSISLRRQKMLEEEIRQLRSEAESVSTALSGMPVVKSVGSNKIPVSVEKIMEVQTQLEEQAAACLSIRCDVMKAIASVPVEQQMEVLRRRYILGQNFSEIADAIHVVVRRVYQLHRQGVDSLKL